MTPGANPVRNSLVTDVPAITAYRIMGMLGGMMMASDAATDVSPAVNAGGYPFCTMAGMMMLPIAATSATAEPEISAKNIDEAKLTMPNPPRLCPPRPQAQV